MVRGNNKSANRSVERAELHKRFYCSCKHWFLFGTNLVKNKRNILKFETLTTVP